MKSGSNWALPSSPSYFFLRLARAILTSRGDRTFRPSACCIHLVQLLSSSAYRIDTSPFLLQHLRDYVRCIMRQVFRKDPPLSLLCMSSSIPGRVLRARWQRRAPAAAATSGRESFTPGAAAAAVPRSAHRIDTLCAGTLRCSRPPRSSSPS